jgi:hypothetical protein
MSGEAQRLFDEWVSKHRIRAALMQLDGATDALLLAIGYRLLPFVPNKIKRWIRGH